MLGLLRSFQLFDSAALLLNLTYLKVDLWSLMKMLTLFSNFGIVCPVYALAPSKSLFIYSMELYFPGADRMGPFWSMRPIGDSHDLLFCADVTKPVEFEMKLWNGHDDNEVINGSSLPFCVCLKFQICRGRPDSSVE